MLSRPVNNNKQVRISPVCIYFADFAVLGATLGSAPWRTYLPRVMSRRDSSGGASLAMRVEAIWREIADATGFQKQATKSLISQMVDALRAKYVKLLTGDPICKQGDRSTATEDPHCENTLDNTLNTQRITAFSAHARVNVCEIMFYPANVVSRLMQRRYISHYLSTGQDI